MAAAILAEKVSSAGSTQGFLLGEAPGRGVKGEGRKRCLGTGPGRRRHCEVRVGVRARPGPAGLAGNRPGPPLLQPVLLAAGAGGQRGGGGAAPGRPRGASRPEARTEAAQIPGAAPEAGE